MRNANDSPRLPAIRNQILWQGIEGPLQATILKTGLTLVAANPEKEFIGFTSSNVIIKRHVSYTILKSKMVDVVEIASTSRIMSFVHYAQDPLRLPQYLGYTSVEMVGVQGSDIFLK